jgi:hypothetical protein
MASEYNIQNINKEICNAVDCNSISEKKIRLYAGDKQIVISVCNNCMKKFKEDNHQNNEPL